MRKNRTKNSLTQHGGYFKAPDFIFELPLSRNAKLILLYLCRRADSTGVSFPSQDTIGRDCSIKSRTTVDKAIEELERTCFIVKGHSEGASNTYQLTEKVLAIIRAKTEHLPVQETNNPCPFNGQPPVHLMDTKEYTRKENTHKESMCVLNNYQLDQLEKKWSGLFHDTYGNEPTESPQKIKKNLHVVVEKVSSELPQKSIKEIFRHSLALIEWYITANEDSDPSKENRWVYQGERKTSRVSKNFKTVWKDYWAVNEPVVEWKTPSDLIHRTEEVSQEKLKSVLDSLDWYKKYKERSKSSVSLNSEPKIEDDRLLEEISKKNQERFNGKFYQEPT